MNRISKRLADIKASGKKALVTYIVHGDPRTDVTLPAMHALVEAGTDVIELGVPFSDPMAEGPVIQRGHERALGNGASLSSAMALVAEFRKTDSETPVVLMGYANPVERMGYQPLAAVAAESGVDGLLTVDLPPEEAKDLDAELKAHGLHSIFLIAPTTVDQRIADVTQLAAGFVYYVSLKGVTGAGHLDISSVESKLADIRKHTALPVLVGFGIKDKASAQAVGAVSDGVVVGSVLVNAMGDKAQAGIDEICETLKQLIEPIRAGLDELTK
ncbi:tryptophan synthase subunit alpha [Teredinibacter turnerae]|uniref:tryptophan synthase subunit alpha n=1 Tax=Teredinibacter turnerae TaxID=2426 RepID=UPI000374AA72|nr:tryptophan synthase subunit alpha [Teredinibacter turnerae]